MYAVRLCITKRTCVNRNYIEPSNRNLFNSFKYLLIVSPLTVSNKEPVYMLNVLEFDTKVVKTHEPNMTG